MLTDQHPITPPPELRRLWAQQAQRMDPRDPVAWLEHVATQAARWGFRQCIKVDAARLEDKLQKARDQELEACCSWADATGWHGAGDMLRAARRPKPLSLAEEALGLLVEGPVSELLDNEVATIRRALERLQELESNG